MTLDQLVTFRMVATLGSFRRAAGVLHLTQPAVSKQIHALESTLGTRLLERGRAVHLTLAGEVLLKYAVEITRLVQAAREELGDFEAQGRGRLAIGAGPTLAHILPPLLETYRTRYPHVSLLLEMAWPPEILRRVQAGELDLGCVLLASPGPAPPPQLTCEPLTHAELVFVQSPATPFVQQDHVTVDDLGAVPWVLSPDGCQYRGYLERRFAERGLVMQLAVEVSGLDVLKRLVQLGLGISLLPQSLVAEEVKNRTLTTFTVQGLQAQSRVCLVYRHDKYIPRAMQGCLDLMREAFARGGIGL